MTRTNKVKDNSKSFLPVFDYNGSRWSIITIHFGAIVSLQIQNLETNTTQWIEVTAGELRDIVKHF